MAVHTRGGSRSSLIVVLTDDEGVNLREPLRPGRGQGRQCCKADGERLGSLHCDFCSDESNAFGKEVFRFSLINKTSESALAVSWASTGGDLLVQVLVFEGVFWSGPFSANESEWQRSSREGY